MNIVFLVLFLLSIIQLMLQHQINHFLLRCDAETVRCSIQTRRGTHADRLLKFTALDMTYYIVLFRRSGFRCCWPDVLEPIGNLGVMLDKDKDNDLNLVLK